MIYFPKIGASVFGWGDSAELKIFKDKLESGTHEVDSKEIIHTDIGLFIYKEGVLFPIVAHKNTKSTERIPNYLDISNLEKTHNNENIYIFFHKAHFVNCQTIRTYNNFVASKKTNGEFIYHILKTADEVKFTFNDQKLLLCKHCQTKIHYEGNIYLDLNINHETFIKMSKVHIKKISATICNPNTKANIYPKGWSEISERIREENGWKCLGTDCEFSFMNFRENRKFLHVHHKDTNKRNVNSLNLIPLCLHCHAKQPNHSDMKQLPQYKEMITNFSKVS